MGLAFGYLNKTGKFQISKALISVKVFVKNNLEMVPNDLKEVISNGVETSTQSINQLTMEEQTSQDDGGVQITCFSEVSNEVTLHFQIIRLQKQIYAWIGCNSAKFGYLYAAAPTRPSNTVSVTSLIGGASDNTGSGVARRLVLKTGLNIILACDIPKNSPMLEADAEKRLVQKLISLGYTKPKM